MKGTWQTTDSGGSGLALVIAVIAAAVVAVPVIHAVTALIHALVIAVAVLAGLALAAGAALVAYRVRRGRPAAPLVVHQARPVTRPAAESLPAPQRPVVERPAEVHLHLHGVSAEYIAAILARREDGPA